MMSVCLQLCGQYCCPLWILQACFILVLRPLASRAHGYHVLHEIANALSSPADLSTCVRICNAFDQPGAGKNLVTLYLMYMS